MDANPDVGLSYSGSVLIDPAGRPIGVRQTPRTGAVDAAHIFKRNPVGNGSAPVLRKAALADIAHQPLGNEERPWFFDETFRRSEDIECWLRLALTTDWVIEGIPGHLTKYRVAGEGLSARTDRQLAAWERMVRNLYPVNPQFFDTHSASARAYQLRYLARRSISSGDAAAALDYLKRAMRSSLAPIWEEPAKSLSTAVAAAICNTGINPLRLSGPFKKAA